MQRLMLWVITYIERCFMNEQPANNVHALENHFIEAIYKKKKKNGTVYCNDHPCKERVVVATSSHYNQAMLINYDLSLH